MFEDDQGRGVRVDASRLSTLLYDRKVRLVVLNACEGARHGVSDAFSGVAQDLVHKGVPAVVAMQFPITDRAAVLFARKFYRPLAEGATIDSAVCAARRALYFHGDDVEWGAPVLYTHSSTGHLFGLEPTWVQRMRAQVARWSWLAALLMIVGLGAYLILHELHRTPHWLPASPECPSPPGVEIRFVRIPEGRFSMGSGRKYEKPKHQVEITRPFCMGQFEVTERQWEQVMEGHPNPPAQAEGDLPQTNVSWDDAQLFVAKLNQRVGSRRFRLPFEAEWEYAARAETTTDYSFKGNGSDLYLYGNCLSNPPHDDGFGGVAPVGQFRPNPWGLYDMHGNVWEWVEDFYDDYTGEPAIDPRGPLQGARRVRRGGGFGASIANCRSAARNSSPPEKRMRDTGFRLVEILDK